MEFLFAFLSSPAAEEPEPGDFDAMAAYSAELAGRRKLRRGGPLAADGKGGARIRVRSGKTIVSDGPFVETKEVIAGFWIVEAADRREALELARACPHAREGAVEVYAIADRRQVRDHSRGAPYLLGFLAEPGAEADPERRREMYAFAAALLEGVLLEIAPLERRDPPPLRIEPRAGRLVVTDGPFAETKETIAGYAVVRVGDRAAAVDLGGKFPHARWGTVEVREILFFDPT